MKIRVERKISNVIYHSGPPEGRVRVSGPPLDDRPVGRNNLTGKPEITWDLQMDEKTAAEKGG